ncbi:ABC transporter substrate-binding protein [Conexibacter sp. JD483]|uniref:ABC transporter substrate-binding protein n=1 Tax=unclassified Conexibacter TaxID=2627773 RepID=UPI002717B849|nr:MULTISPECIES: ABC transporter substrate-binding protein [unclassified Conexibacter]MDO8187600.1 ABC transporter substrate-binding protein [Conexibacter sp. CPCC 205706]MDO8201068.1 ABC transporter substrate-binding protein [Conexibacter sp. CPCC 205762]MDR9371827.1 ABC transporter substrate-binding protein [Conexibacter sp. JD483]
MTLRPTRRGFIAGTAGAAATIFLAACGSDDDGGSTNASATATSPQGSGFPITVSDRYGETTVERMPERVVVYGYNDHDTVLALGVVPVGLIKWIPEWKRGVGPWSLRALGDARPELFEGQEIPFERIAALRPDLIVAVGQNLRDSDHDRLRQIAPIVSTPDGYPAWGLPPTEQAVQIGTALGMRAETERLVSGLDDLFARTRRENPGFAGRTVMVVTPTADGQMSVFSDTDARGRLVASLGFRQPAAVADVVGDEFYAYLSPEKFDLLDVDALLVLGYDRPSVAALDRMATYQQLDVVRRGGAVIVGDMDTAMALAAGTVTSIPYALGRTVPQLRAALAKA